MWPEHGDCPAVTFQADLCSSRWKYTDLRDKSGDPGLDTRVDTLDTRVDESRDTQVGDNSVCPANQVDEMLQQHRNVSVYAGLENIHPTGNTFWQL